MSDLSLHIKALSVKYSIQPTKLRGQNFLISENVLEKIIAAAELKPDDTILEIGPGLGILTCELVKAAGKVIAVESDIRFCKILQSLFTDARNFELICDDVLKLPATKIRELRHLDYKIVANIPYYITSQILAKFLGGTSRPSILVLMIQREVANRMLERGGKSSRLSIFVNYFGEPELVANVRREAFQPAPKVDSSIIKIKTRTFLPLSSKDQEDFFKIVKVGFSAPRKKLLSNLSSLFFKSELEAAFNQTGIGLNARAENLHLEDWLKLFRQIR